MLFGEQSAEKKRGVREATEEAAGVQVRVGWPCYLVKGGLQGSAGETRLPGPRSYSGGGASRTLVGLF